MTLNHTLTMNTDYSQYLIKISSDPIHYGPDCGDAQAVQVAQAIANLVTGRFPGIITHVLRPEDLAPQIILGPDPDVVAEIRDWVNDNWWPSLLTAGAGN